MVTIVVSKMTNIICTRLPVGWTLYVESTIWGHYEIKFRDHAVSNLSDWFILYNCPLNAWIGVLPSEGLPVDRSRIKQAFLSLPIAEAFQHLFLDQNIEQGWSYTLELLLLHSHGISEHNDAWQLSLLHIKITETESGDLLRNNFRYNHKVTSQSIKVMLISRHCVQKTYSMRILCSRSVWTVPCMLSGIAIWVPCCGWKYWVTCNS